MTKFLKRLWYLLWPTYRVLKVGWFPEEEAVRLIINSAGCTQFWQLAPLEIDVELDLFRLEKVERIYE